MGRFRSHWSDVVDAYIFYIHDTPAGFCVVNHGSMVEPAQKNDPKVHDIAEFFITPNFRGHKFGAIFVAEIFKMYPGTWEVRQLPALADNVRHFWRSVIGRITHNNFVEIHNHPHWDGYMQSFEIK